MTATADSVLRPSGLDPGECVLLLGPAMTGKRPIMHSLLGASPDRSAVVVTTKTPTERYRRRFLAAQPDPDAWRLSIVDCVSRGGLGEAPDGPDTKLVSTPGDLTGIGIAVSGFLRECYHDPRRRRTRVGLHSLSTLRMYADLRRVYQFVHVLTGRLASSGFPGVFAMDTVTGDQEARETIAPLFDGTIETRHGEAGTELRVRGLDIGPRAWTPCGD